MIFNYYDKKNGIMSAQTVLAEKQLNTASKAAPVNIYAKAVSISFPLTGKLNHCSGWNTSMAWVLEGLAMRIPCPALKPTLGSF